MQKEAALSTPPLLNTLSSYLLWALKSTGFLGLDGKEGSCSSSFLQKASKSVSEIESIQFNHLLLDLLWEFWILDSGNYLYSGLAM